VIQILLVLSYALSSSLFEILKFFGVLNDLVDDIVFVFFYGSEFHKLKECGIRVAGDKG